MEQELSNIVAVTHGGRRFEVGDDGMAGVAERMGLSFSDKTPETEGGVTERHVQFPEGMTCEFSNGSTGPLPGSPGSTVVKTIPAT